MLYNYSNNDVSNSLNMGYNILLHLLFFRFVCWYQNSKTISVKNQLTSINSNHLFQKNHHKVVPFLICHGIFVIVFTIFSTFMALKCVYYFLPLILILIYFWVCNYSLYLIFEAGTWRKLLMPVIFV